MAEQRQVSCINKNDRDNPQERITHIGGYDSTNGRWKYDLDKAIAGIENRKWEFFVSQGGSRVRIIVSTSRSGRKYLKTENDGQDPNNLLSLSECP